MKKQKKVIRKTKAVSLLRKLVVKLDEVTRSSSYDTVFTVASVHGVMYEGPTFHEELKEAKTYLERRGILK